VARIFFGSDGVVPFSEGLAAASAEVFRSLGSPRRRAGDIAIGVTAAAAGAALLTRNAKDFAGVPDLTLEAVGS
jgi:predicted nucleic acid-binding protein